MALSKDDTALNIALVKEVEKHPILYNHTLPGYINREEQEEEWQKVADALHEPIQNIKQKWASLRGSLCRHIRQSKYGGFVRRPYYMAPYMSYLIPFTRVRGPLPKPNLDDSDSGIVDGSSHSLDTEDTDRRSRHRPLSDSRISDPEDYLLDVKPDIEECLEYEEEYKNNSDEFATHFMAAPCSNSSCDPLPPAKRQKLISPAAHAIRAEVSSFVHAISESEEATRSSSQGWFPEVESSVPVAARKLNLSVNEVESSSVEIVAAAMRDRNDPEINFLKSLLPDIKKMTDSQRNKFKISVLQLIQQTLYES